MIYSTLIMLLIPQLDNYIVSYIDPLVDQIGLVNKYFYSTAMESDLISRLHYLAIERKLPIAIVLAEAFKSDFTDVVKYFLYKSILSFRTKNVMTMINDTFSYYCRSANINMAKWSINFAEKIGWSLNIHCRGNTPFINSCKSGNIEMIKWLINLGNEMKSPICIHTPDGVPFKYLCQYGHLDAVKWFVNMINEGNRPKFPYNGKEILNKTCINGHIDMVKWLIYLNERDNTLMQNFIMKSTTLHYVCENGHLEMAKWLVKKASSKNIQKSGVYVGDINYYFNIFSLHDTFEQCCLNNKLEAAKFIVDLADKNGKKIRVENRNYDGRYIFATCCVNSYREVAQWLIDLGNQRGTPT